MPKELVDDLCLEECVNEVCPWSGDPVSEDSLTLYRGEVVAKAEKLAQED